MIGIARWLRRTFLCSHSDTTEEWERDDRASGLIFEVRRRVLWRCNRCGKETRRRKINREDQST